MTITELCKKLIALENVIRDFEAMPHEVNDKSYYTALYNMHKAYTNMLKFMTDLSNKKEEGGE